MGPDRIAAVFAEAPAQAPLAMGVVLEDHGQSQTYHGRTAVAIMLRAFFGDGFSDGRFQLHATLYDEHTVLFSCTFHGRQDGLFFGIPATGREVRVPMSLVCRIGDGLIHHIAWYYDAGTLLRQLGLA